jgi:hypothetical protein
VQKLCAGGGFESGRSFLDEAQSEVDVTEQTPLLGLPERRPGCEFHGSTGVVQQRRGEQEVGTQTRVELCRFPADRRYADGVLEQAAGVRMVGLRGRQTP